jgi:hypothetical protein
MRKFAIPLLALVISATPVMIVSVVPAQAETNGSGGIETGKKKIQESRSISDRKPASPAWPPPYDEDFDRKSAGAGGGGM